MFSAFAGVAQPCTGTLSTGAIIVTDTVVGGATIITLKDTGATVADGIQYRWLSSSDSLSWSEIPGDTSTTYSFTDTGTTYYAFIVICTVSGQTDTSGIVSSAISTTAISSIYSNQTLLTVYPNPANDDLMIQMNTTLCNLYIVTDGIGKIMLNQQLNQPKSTFTTSIKYYHPAYTLSP